MVVAGVVDVNEFGSYYGMERDSNYRFVLL